MLIIIAAIIISILLLIWDIIKSQQPRTTVPDGEGPPMDLAYEDDPLFRLSLNDIGTGNTVFCWPSVSGIIVNDNLTPVELDFLSLSRFHEVLRPESDSENTTLEDALCRRLRLTGGKWFVDYHDYHGAQVGLRRPTTPEEDEILLIGWPEDKKGVWVLRQKGIRGKECGGCKTHLQWKKDAKLWRWRGQHSFKTHGIVNI
jgi:hypothetical protein